MLPSTMRIPYSWTSSLVHNPSGRILQSHSQPQSSGLIDFYLAAGGSRRWRASGCPGGRTGMPILGSCKQLEYAPISTLARKATAGLSNHCGSIVLPVRASRNRGNRK